MPHSLLIVESPAKVRTIRRYLGPDFSIESSVGHIKDLPVSRLGVDLEKDFAPQYEVIQGKQKVIQNLKKAAREVDVVYLALDPDREGEAIAWHIAETLKRSRSFKGEIYRVMFNEITKRAIEEALESPGDLNQNRFESQQARRILDRLVGYQISPILWEKVRRGLSAGRVQSVAVRMVVEKERQIKAFQSEEFWTITASLEGPTPPPFEARLLKYKQKKAKIANGTDAQEIVDHLQQAAYCVARVETKERKRSPSPPFITSRLQQEASRKLYFTARRTMQIAQQLYEGVELGEEGSVGLITYMRTDSTRISNEAIEAVRALILDRYGEEYLPEKPRTYRNKQKAQDAHEAIRPTSFVYTPEKVRPHLTNEQFRLYRLIWNRFVACQMTPALYDQTVVDIEAGEGLFRVTGQVMRFPGFTRIYTEGRDDPTPTGQDPSQEEEQDKSVKLPSLEAEQILQLLQLHPEQHFTQPPPRFTESTLVRELEEKGIGRPSTYATILSVIQDKGYVEKREGRFHPTELGMLITELLVEHFPKVLDVTFTAEMESKLDKIEEGDINWLQLLHEFHGPFQETLVRAREEMRNVKREEIPTDIDCERCGANMVIRWGRNGSFLACSAYPECKNTMEFTRDEEGKIIPQPDEPVPDEHCPTCSAVMLKKNGKFGPFLACSRYPECKTTKPIGIGVDCPRENCDGELVEKRSRKGKVFYSCSRYPDCDYALWDRPLPDEACPLCQHPFLVESKGRGRGRNRREKGIYCPNEECGYHRPL